MDFEKVFFDIVRSFFYFFCEGLLQFFNMIYSGIESIATIDITQFDFIWQWWRALCTLLFFFIITRMIVRFLRTLVDDDILDRFNPITLLSRLAAVALIMGLLPNILGGLSTISSVAITSIGSLTGNGEVDAAQIIFNGATGSAETPDYKTININEYDKEKKEYKYLNDNWQLIFLLATSAIGCVLLVFIGLQIAQRLVGLAFKILLSPYALSGIVDPDDRTWGTWCKLVIADLLTNFYQMLLVLLAMILMSSLPSSIPGFAKVIFLLGALMAVMNAPSGVAQILGADIGVGTALQQMQSLNMMGHMATTGVAMGGAAAVTSAAAGIYGTGRMLGANSLLNQMGRSSGSFSSGWGDSASGSIGNEGNSGNSDATNDERQGDAAASSYRTEGAGIKRASIVRPGSPLDRINRTAMRNSGADRPMVRYSKSLYAMSAERLGRQVQTRNVHGGMQTRNSRFVQASHAYHSLKRNPEGDGNQGGEDEE